MPSFARISLFKYSLVVCNEIIHDIGDLFVGQALGQFMQHFQLARGPVFQTHSRLTSRSATSEPESSVAPAATARRAGTSCSPVEFFKI